MGNMDFGHVNQKLEKLWEKEERRKKVADALLYAGMLAFLVILFEILINLH